MGAQEYFLNFLNSDYPKIYLNKKIVIDAISSDQNNREAQSEKNFDIKNIVLKDVKFNFKDKEIFSGINLRINKGEKILVYGDSGEGKSILLDIICGFREPISGEILINEKRIDSQSFGFLQKRVGLISQNISLVNSSLIENVGFGKKISEIDINKVKESLKLSGLEEFCDDQKLFNFRITQILRIFRKDKLRDLD